MVTCALGLFFVAMMIVYHTHALATSSQTCYTGSKTNGVVGRGSALFITLASEQNMATKRFHVTRVRHVLEGIVIPADSAQEAVEKSRQTKRRQWKHIDSKRRRGYKADEVHSRITE